MAERECSRCGEVFEYERKPGQRGRDRTKCFKCYPEGGWIKTFFCARCGREQSRDDRPGRAIYCKPCAENGQQENFERYRQARLEKQRQWSLSTTRQCLVCGGDFHPATKLTVCCSKECQQVRHKQQMIDGAQKRREQYKKNHGRSRPRRERGPFNCKGCGKDYMTRCREGEGEKYCSRKCSDADGKTIQSNRLFGKSSRLPTYTRIKPCDECGTYLVKYANGRRICESCKSTREQARKQTTCKHCGTEFVMNSKGRGNWTAFCSDKCKAAAQAATRKTAAKKARKKRGSGRSRSRARYYGVPYEYINVMKVFERDGWRCQICGVSTPKSRRGTKHANAPELDHRIPLSKGGGHLYSNVQCACKACNAAKGNKTEIGQHSLYTWDDLAA